MYKYNINTKKERMSTVSVSFSLFAALMLVQTSYLNLGTIIAFSTIAIVFLAFFAVDRKIIMSNANILLLLFLFLTFFRTALTFQTPSYRLIAQGLLTILIISFEANQREKKFLEKAVFIASIFYSAYIIYACLQASKTSYVHEGIKLFGTTLDPNFVGIPLIMGFALSINNIIERKYIWRSIGAITSILIAIFYTASRTNFLVILVACTLRFILFIFNSKSKAHYKFFTTALVLTLLVAAYIVLSNQLSDHWDRMSYFGEGSDNGRFDLWRQAIDIWLDNLLFGVGNGGFYSLVGMATHNTYLTVLVETGFVGFILFISFIGCILKMGWKCGHGIFVMIVAVLLHSFFVDSLDNRCVWVAICFVGFYSSRHAERKTCLRN